MMHGSKKLKFNVIMSEQGCGKKKCHQATETAYKRIMNHNGVQILLTTQQLTKS